MTLTSEEHQEIQKHARYLAITLTKVMRRLIGYSECKTPQDRDTWISVVALHDSLVTYWCDGEITKDPYA